MTKTATIPSDDLIRKLSPETFGYYVNGEVFSGIPTEKRDTGLFIRYGGIIVCGIHANRHLGFVHGLRHYELLDYLHEKFGSEMAAMDQEDLDLLSNGEMSDGGRIKLYPGTSEIAFFGSSVDFGRANELGRQKTNAIAQGIVGSEISIRQITV